MLQLYDSNHTKLEGLTNYKEANVQREINQLDILSFLYPVNDPKYSLIQEECYIRTKDNEYVVKEVNTQDDDWVQFVCKINIEDIQGTPVSHFETIEQSCQDAVNLALAGTGWTIGSCNVEKLRTVRKNSCTVYDVLIDIQTAYGCEMAFDAVKKKVYIYQSMGSDKGTYFIEQLNLKKLQAQRNSYDYITRLIPIGKDGLDITSVNGGKNYIENCQYSNKVLTAYWEDNRYTAAQDLYDDAVVRVNYLSMPFKAYKADIIDLVNISEKYSILDYDLGDTITLLSKQKGVKEKQRIVKIDKYLNEPEKNTVEIANKIPSLEYLQVRFQDTADTVDTVTTSAGEVDGSKVDGIDYSKVQNISIGTADIQDGAIVNAKIGDLQVTEAKIADASVDTAKIKEAAITTALIANGAIGAEQVADSSITDGKIVSLTANKITAGTIDAGEIDVINLHADNIIVGTINGNQITDGAIDSTKLASSAVTAEKIASGVITADKLQEKTITADKIANNTITGDKIAAGSIKESQLNWATHLLF